MCEKVRMKDVEKEERTFLLCFHEVLKEQNNAVSQMVQNIWKITKKCQNESDKWYFLTIAFIFKHRKYHEHEI